MFNFFKRDKKEETQEIIKTQEQVMAKTEQGHKLFIKIGQHIQVVLIQ